MLDVTNQITNWIFPRRCLVCSADIEGASLCLTCRSLITLATKSTALVHDKRPALFFYEGVVRRLLVNAKFQRSTHAAHTLMQIAREVLLGSPLLDEIREFEPDVVTFVPTHWLRRLMRGVDVPISFALVVAMLLERPVVSTLCRKSFFQRQVLHSQRHARAINIRGAFSHRSTMSLGRVLVIDDIVTTGATFDESKKVLNEVSDVVLCLALARTP